MNGALAGATMNGLPLPAAHRAHRPVIPAGTLLDVIRCQRYGVEYQPIVNVETGEVAGYEALARFYDVQGKSIPPYAVFEALHANPLSLFQVEHEMKVLQMDRAPRGYALFVNLDPHAFAVCEPGDRTNPLTDLLVSCADVVVEVIENTSVSDAQKSLAMLDALVGRNVPLALDDIGAASTLIVLDVMAAVDYLKFDRSWLRCMDDRGTRAMCKAMIGYARESGKQTIQEGVETRTDLELARALGIDYVQGYHFRELFLDRTTKRGAA